MSDDGDEAAGGDPPPREEAAGRGQGHGEWLERRTVEAVTDWGYVAKRSEPLLATEADVVARREDPRGDPADFLVIECKDWLDRSIGSDVIFRLVMQAYVGRAMPVLVHTTSLTARAWRLAQAYDIRLVTDQELYELDDVPALPEWRPPKHRRPHRAPRAPRQYRNNMTPVLIRQDGDSEAPALGGPATGPAYVSDRSGHHEYGDREGD